MNFAIIVAAGKSRRMKSNQNKIFLPLFGKPMVYYALKAFQSCRLIDEIIVVAQKNGIKKIHEIKNKYNFNKIKNIVAGGEERQDSVLNGLTSIKNPNLSEILSVDKKTREETNKIIEEELIVES